MQTFTTKIRNVDVVLEVSDTESQCYLSMRDTEGVECTASLECADATGELDSARSTVLVSPLTITLIREWAEAKGY